MRVVFHNEKQSVHELILLVFFCFVFFFLIFVKVYFFLILYLFFFIINFFFYFYFLGVIFILSSEIVNMIFVLKVNSKFNKKILHYLHFFIKSSLF